VLWGAKSPHRNRFNFQFFQKHPISDPFSYFLFPNIDDCLFRWKWCTYHTFSQGKSWYITRVKNRSWWILDIWLALLTFESEIPVFEEQTWAEKYLGNVSLFLVLIFVRKSMIICYLLRIIIGISWNIFDLGKTRFRMHCLAIGFSRGIIYTCKKTSQSCYEILFTSNSLI